MEQRHKHCRASHKAVQKTDAESRLDGLDRNKMFKPRPRCGGTLDSPECAEYRPQQHANRGKALYRKDQVRCSGGNLSGNELDSLRRICGRPGLLIRNCSNRQTAGHCSHQTEIGRYISILVFYGNLEFSALLFCQAESNSKIKVLFETKGTLRFWYSAFPKQGNVFQSPLPPGPFDSGCRRCAS